MTGCQGISLTEVFQILNRQPVAEHMQQGIQQGMQQGEHSINSLILCLAELGRTSDIIKSASDPEYQKKLLKEFGLLLE